MNEPRRSSELTISLIFSNGEFSLIRIKVPERDCISSSVCGLDFVWVSSVRPEKGDSVENWFNVCDSIGPTVGKDPKKAATLVYVPTDIQVIYASYAAPVTIRIVNMFNIV